MKPHLSWSYRPYAPLMYDVGTPTVCRVAPGEDFIHIEWLPAENGAVYRLYLGKKGEEPAFLAETDKTEYTFTNLIPYEDYCFKVSCSAGQSRLRLARTGDRDGTDGVTVNYLHPEDDAYAFSGRYLCSPSLVRHPDGFLLASMDVFESGAAQNLTLIFRSDDEGLTWHYVSELFPCFWGKMFIHRGRLYMTGVSTEYGDLLLGVSDDGGVTFSQPIVLFRGACHSKQNGIHKNPQPVVTYAGRIWNTCEWGSWAQGFHAPMVFSCAEDADLMNPENWSLTPPVAYNPAWEGVAKGKTNGNIEGTLAVLRDGFLYNIMRYDMSATDPKYGLVLAYRVNEKDPDAPLTYSHAIRLPGNFSKFEIQYDETSDCYYSIITRILSEETRFSRNLCSLMVSKDGENWSLACDLIDKRDEDPQYTGFQYTDFLFDGEDLLWLCREGVNKPHNFHDANYSVFHRLKNFRRYAL